MAVKQLIERVELDSSASSITFSSIPQTFAHLQILILARSDGAATIDTIAVSFNGTGDTDESSIQLFADGSTAESGTNTIIKGGPVPTPSLTANTFSNTSFYVSNYTASQAKPTSMDAVIENNATLTSLELHAGLWDNTSAITSIAFSLSSSNFVTGTTISLYGITRGGDGTVTTA